MLLFSLYHYHFHNSSTLNLNSYEVYQSFHRGEATVVTWGEKLFNVTTKAEKNIIHNVTKKTSLCLLIPHDYPVWCKCFANAVYPLKTPAYLQIYSFKQNLIKELLPLKELPSHNLLPSSQSNILIISLLVSILDYIITHSSLFSCNISGTTFFH